MMARADPTAVFMHCLPAYRGFEVSADVIDGPQSVVFQQGHNRLHARTCRDALASPGRRSADDAKVQRQQAIARLIEQHEVTNQPQLVELLADEGIAATQATVSRDLDDLGAVKVRVPGGATVVRGPRVRARAGRAARSAAAGDGGVGRRGHALGQPRDRAHPARLRPRRRLGARPQRDRRLARHRRRRRHDDVRRHRARRRRRSWRRRSATWPGSKGVHG